MQCVLILLREHTSAVLYIFDQSANILDTIHFLCLAALLGFSARVCGMVVFFLHYSNSYTSFPCEELVKADLRVEQLLSVNSLGPLS